MSEPADEKEPRLSFLDLAWLEKTITEYSAGKWTNAQFIARMNLSMDKVNKSG